MSTVLDAIDLYEFEEEDELETVALEDPAPSSATAGGRKPRSRTKKGASTKFVIAAAPVPSSNVECPPLPQISPAEIMQLDHIIAQTGWLCQFCQRVMRVKGHSWTEFKDHCDKIHKRPPHRKRVMFTDFETDCVEKPDGFFIPRNILPSAPHYGGPAQRQLEDVRYFQCRGKLPPPDDSTPPQPPPASQMSPLAQQPQVYHHLPAAPPTELALHICNLHQPPPCHLNGQYVYVPRAAPVFPPFYPFPPTMPKPVPPMNFPDKNSLRKAPLVVTKTKDSAPVTVKLSADATDAIKRSARAVPLVLKAKQRSRSRSRSRNQSRDHSRSPSKEKTTAQWWVSDDKEAEIVEDVSVKVSWEGKIFRIRLAALNFPLLMDALIKRFPPYRAFVVKYADEDGDLVTVTTTKDLEEAVRVTSKLVFTVTARV